MVDAGAGKNLRMPVALNGPYAVTGPVALAKISIGVNSARESAVWTEGGTFNPPAAYLLCRCGRSAGKPFCDGAHAKTGFDGAETATDAPYLEQAQAFDGPVVALNDAQPLCASRGSATVTARSGVSSGRRAATTRRADGWNRCSSVHRDGSSPGIVVAAALEAEAKPAILLVEDPEQGVSGPSGGVAASRSWAPTVANTRSAAA